MDDAPYQPIDCNYYDLLLERATLRRPCRIELLLPQGPETLAEAVIEDVYTADGAEYLRLAGSQTPIRLDAIVSVDGLPRPGACGV
jgi:Rho-binding antiterminator